MYKIGTIYDKIVFTSNKFNKENFLAEYPMTHPLLRDPNPKHKNPNPV